jgi:hypothetical protein
MLKDPCYAGAFVYGRTASRMVMREDRPRRSYGHKAIPGEWQILIRDHHPGYISWDEYLRHQETLEANLARAAGERSGAPKSGPALLAGLLRCGRCGRKLRVVLRDMRKRGNSDRRPTQLSEADLGALRLASATRRL